MVWVVLEPSGGLIDPEILDVGAWTVVDGGGYFDLAYFDPAYFDTSAWSVTPPSAGVWA